MKSIKLLIALTLLLAACTKSDEAIEQSATNRIRTFTASIESSQTRVSAVSAGEKCYSIVWNEDDNISILQSGDNPTNIRYAYSANSKQFTPAVEAEEEIPASTSEEETPNQIYAVYPYAESNTISSDGKIELTLPTVQSYAENSFGLGANTMVAQTTDDNLSFKNVGAYLKLILWGENVKVSSITLVSNTTEQQLAGTALVSFDNEGNLLYEWVAEGEKSTSITLNCPDGGVKIGASAAEATPFWIVVPPQEFANGFTITVTDIDGKEFVKSTSKKIDLVRNFVQPMAALQVIPVQPADEVWCYDAEGNKTTIDFVEGQPISLTNFLPVTINSETLAPTDPNDPNLIARMNIKSIIIPEGVTELGFGALGYCTNLTDITLPSTLQAIGPGAFAMCQSLTAIDIPDGVTTIGDMAFAMCQSLTTIDIPDGVTTIGAGAFAQSGLESITIPSGVTTIGDGAFQKTALKSVVIEEGTEELTLGIGAFYYNESLESVTIPSNVKTIPEEAFNLCSSLSSVTLAEGVQTIGKRAFNGCKELASITLPNGVTTIEEKAFSNTGLTGEFTIPNSVTTIGEYAFLDDDRDSRITKITLSNQLRRIEIGTFAGCEYLVEFDFNGAPIEYIGERAFSSCNLGNFVVESTATLPSPGLTLDKGALSNCGAYGITLPENIVSIGDGALSGLTNSDRCLKWIYCKAETPPAITDVTTIHSNNHYISKIYVPATSLDTYLDSWYAVQFTGHANGDYTYDETTQTFTYVGKQNCRYDNVGENKGDYQKEDDDSYTYVGMKGDYVTNSNDEYVYKGDNRGDYIKDEEQYTYVGGNGSYILASGVVGYRKTVSIVAGPPPASE